MRIPPALVETWSREPDWPATLPQLVSECVEAWSLELEEPIETPGSLVVPAGDVVLKLNAPSHYEADHEADALELWDGNGAVRLVARDDTRRALLVERCHPGIELWHADVDEIAIVADLVPRLQVDLASGHPFRSLSEEADRWAEEVPERYSEAGQPFEQSLLDFAIDVYRTVDRSATYLVNQDLHGGNVLSAEREPWLVIDPKPLAGERELEGIGLLRNAASANRLLNGWRDLEADVSLWLDALSALGFDRERTRGWGVAHHLAWAWSERRGWSQGYLDGARRILNAR